MMEIVEYLNLLCIHCPRLLKIADDRLAHKPNNACSLCVRPFFPKNMPKTPPYVQLIPRIVPQPTSTIIKFFEVLQLSFTKEKTDF